MIWARAAGRMRVERRRRIWGDDITGGERVGWMSPLNRYGMPMVNIFTSCYPILNE
jgi:hypothetical protein